MKCWPVPIANASDRAPRGTRKARRGPGARAPRAARRDAPARRRASAAGSGTRASSSRSSTAGPRGPASARTARARSARAAYRPRISPTMSIVARIAMLASAATEGLTDEARRGTGGSTGRPRRPRPCRRQAVGRRPERTGSRPDRTSLDDLDHGFCPVLDRMTGDDTAAQLGTDGGSYVGPGRTDGHEGAGESAGIPRRREQRQRQVAEERLRAPRWWSRPGARRPLPRRQPCRAPRPTPARGG